MIIPSNSPTNPFSQIANPFVTPPTPNNPSVIMAWVQGETGALSYPMAPNTRAYLFDMNEVEFIFDNKDDSIFVWADEPKTEDVFMNYLSNAFHYCEGEKKIKVFLEKKDDDIVRINVFNTGRQLNEEEQKRVWDKFYKADEARSRDYGGTGIGLSVVKAIMSSLKMAYGCYNSDDGVTFYFELPTK